MDDSQQHRRAAHPGAEYTSDSDDNTLFTGKYLILTHPPYEKVVDQSQKSNTEAFNEATDYYYRKHLYHCMELLQKHPGGRCGIIMPQSFFRNPGAKKQRSDLFSNYHVRLLARLPETMFTTVRKQVRYHSYLLYFDKQGTPGNILRCNIREDEAPASSRPRSSSDGASFKEAENLWERWRARSSEKPFSFTGEEQKYAWVIDAAATGERDPAYRLIDDVPPRPEEEPASSLGELMEQLVRETRELHELARQLQKRIKEGL